MPARRPPSRPRGPGRRWLPDLAAGLTVWAVLVPESLAYATIAGVPPAVGLYAAPAALVLYALLGTSRALVVGPMSATAALSAVAVGPAVAAGADPVAVTATLALLVGAVAAVAGLLRLGFVAGLISEPVLKGFVVGVALTIVVGQLPALLGVDTDADGFVRELLALLRALPQVSWLPLAVGLGSLVLLVALERAVPRLPAPLVVVAAAVALSAALDLSGRGVEVVGRIERGFGPVGPPGLGLAVYGDLLAAAVGIVLVGFVEGLGAAKASPGARDVDANRELLALGAANAGAGLCGGMVVNGSLSKTAVATAAGVRTRAGGLVAGVLTLLTVVLLAPVFGPLPEPTLAAVVVVAVWRLVDVRGVARLSRYWARHLGGRRSPLAHPDLAAAVATLAGVLLLDTLAGLLVGVVVSAVLLLLRAGRPRVAELGALRLPGGGTRWLDVDRHPAARPVPGTTVLRLEGALWYAVSDGVRDRLEATEADLVVLDAAAVPFVDVQGAVMLTDVARDLASRGRRLVVAGATGQVRDALRAAGEETGVGLPLGRDVEDVVAPGGSPVTSEPATGAGRPP
ncbi:SulP family inorganic anion transporter [Aquipuribacter sp. SD81]|uniref:SulP family inorganic anion transporter n=1 Tax=Aquipuribacter sp. SD81 TaxID=3127703 RepID=UPI003016E70E